jgi:magnesium transporter
MPKRRRQGKRSRQRPITPGAAPGTLTIDPEAPKPVIRVIAYGPDEVTEQLVTQPAELAAYMDAWPVTWINVDGLGDEETLRTLGEHFGLHRLALEDVVSLGQRPKVEPYENCLFVVARMPAQGGSEDTEQLSLFLGEKFILTFQERSGDCLDGVRARIRQSKTVIRRSGPDYLAYALIDAVVDAYFPVLEQVGEELELLDDEVLESPQRDTVSKIHGVKHRLQALRRAIGPHREAINALLRDSADFVKPETAIYLRDCYDHLLRLSERVEVYREQCADLMSTYLTMVSNRMNEVMKVLTILATIFIPLSFVAGLYRMNFNPELSRWNMPELTWIFGYPFALTVMAVMTGGLVLFFWRKGWFD